MFYVNVTVERVFHLGGHLPVISRFKTRSPSSACFPPIIANSHQLLPILTSICFRLTPPFLYSMTPSLHFPALTLDRTALASVCCAATSGARHCHRSARLLIVRLRGRAAPAHDQESCAPFRRFLPGGSVKMHSNQQRRN